MSSVWYLEDVNLYKILCPHKLEEFEKDHTFDQYKKGEFIYFPDDKANKIFLIAKGKVKIGYYTEDGEEVIKAILRKGDVFGEMAILGEDRRKDFAVAQENETILCPMSVNLLHELMRENKPFSLYIYKLMGLRIKRLERRLDLILFKDARSRLTEFIKDLATELGERKSGKVIIKHPYTQKDMADLIGISRPTMNILLNELSDEGVISFHRKLIKIENPEVLDLA